jgi:hypothetical protein
MKGKKVWSSGAEVHQTFSVAQKELQTFIMAYTEKTRPSGQLDRPKPRPSYLPSARLLQTGRAAFLLAPRVPSQPASRVPARAIVRARACSFRPATWPLRTSRADRWLPRPRAHSLESTCRRRSWPARARRVSRPGRSRARERARSCALSRLPCGPAERHVPVSGWVCMALLLSVDVSDDTTLLFNLRI